MAEAVISRLGELHILTVPLELRQIVSDIVIVTLIADEDMSDQRQSRTCIERSCINRGVVARIRLPEQSRTARSAKAAPRLRRSTKPGKGLKPHDFKVFTRRRCRRHMMAAHTPTLAAMAGDDLPQGAVHTIAHGPAEAGTRGTNINFRPSQYNRSSKSLRITLVQLSDHATYLSTPAAQEPKELRPRMTETAT